MIIREIKIEECKAVLEIEQACFSDSWSIEDFEYQVSGKYTKLIGAFVDDKIVGFVNTVCVVDEVEINNIAVLKQYRKKHIANNLLKYALSLYPRAERVLLEVRKSNIPAIKLYEKFDFEKYGERKNYYQLPNEDAVLMCKTMKGE